MSDEQPSLAVVQAELRHVRELLERVEAQLADFSARLHGIERDHAREEAVSTARRWLLPLLMSIGSLTVGIVAVATR